MKKLAFVAVLILIFNFIVGAINISANNEINVFADILLVIVFVIGSIIESRAD